VAATEDVAVSKPVLAQLNLVVRDMEATVAFYRTLGLDIPDAKLWRSASGLHHVDLELANGFGLDFDSHEVAKVYNAAWRRPEGGGSRSVIGFSVASREAVDETYTALTGAGHSGLQPPYDAFWGARYAIVEDPDGNHVGLMSPIDPARRTAGPDL
jgi:catechol 2,3-dioxygenase-like lactoylglutathione lyase family enzyme